MTYVDKARPRKLSARLGLTPNAALSYRFRAAGAFAALIGALALTSGAGALAASGSGGVGTGDEQGEEAAGSSEGTFPIRGPHTYGDGLGAERGHQGQDLMAKCGRPVVAAMPGTVEFVDYQAGGAGNYVVIDGDGRLHDTVYMHLLERPTVRRGERVGVGEQLGSVGSTGRSSACHLHFEMWSPRWSAGKPIDPKPYLKRWDRGA